MNSILKVVHLNESIVHSSAPYRLHKALIGKECCSHILTMRSTENDDVIVLSRSLFSRVIRKVDSLVSGLEKEIFYSVRDAIPFSFYRAGVNILHEKRIREADVIILHWICGGFISLSCIRRLKKLNKPMLIVCHDNWHFTGGCHVRLGCEKYQFGCGKCPQLESKIRKDWSFRLLRSKQKSINGAKICVVSPSKWMDENVGKSLLFREVQHTVIPNIIDTSVFRCQKSSGLREKFHLSEDVCILAFGAVNATATPYKGYRELMEALDFFEENYLGDRSMEAFVFGASEGDERLNRKIRFHYLGYLSEKEMVELYNSVDIYVVPSLEDSFNNTVAESLACETPVVSFTTGGIVDIIEHKKNGYLAKYACPEDLAKGIEWVSRNNSNNLLGKNGRNKVIHNYTPEVISGKYIEVMKDMIGK